jgi:hypothetical protein
MKIRPKGRSDPPGLTLELVKLKRYAQDKLNGRHVFPGEGNFTLRLLKRPGLSTALKLIAKQDEVSLQKLVLDTLGEMVHKRIPKLEREE